LGSVVQAGTAAVAAPVAEWLAARADGAAALALRQLAEGQPIRHVAKNVALTQEEGMPDSQRYRQRRFRAGLAQAATTEESGLAGGAASAGALACGRPPEGCSRWPVRLLTEEVVKR
jgi:hypothetical protein